MNDIPDYSTLRAHMGQISPTAEKKVIFRLDRHCRAFIELSPFLVIATSDGEGRMDASPRGDPPGFVRVLDDTTLFLPDWPGNNRVDTLGNVLAAPGVGLVFFVPGVDETLRVNGTARLVTEPGLLAESEVLGRVPKTGMLVAVEEIFFHCAKALKRSKLWDPALQIERGSFPTLGRILAEQTQVGSAEETDARIEASYRARLY